MQYFFPYIFNGSASRDLHPFPIPLSFISGQMEDDAQLVQLVEAGEEGDVSSDLTSAESDDEFLEPEVDDEDGFEDVRCAFRLWRSQSLQIRILAAGKTGSGKSSLINGILKKQVTIEGGNLTSETGQVTPYTSRVTVEDSPEVGAVGQIAHVTTTINRIKVTVWDTPGLNDPSTNEEETLSSIRENCRDQVDLFVYCIQMTQTRIGQDEYDAIADLTRALGADIWKNAVFALTFANEVRVPPSCQNTTLEDYFDDQVYAWKHSLRKAVKDAGVPRDVVIDVPVVPCGYRDRAAIPDTDDWIVSFWKDGMERVRPGATLAFASVVNVDYVRDRETIRRLFPRKSFLQRLDDAYRSSERVEYPPNLGMPFPHHRYVLNINTQRLIDLLGEMIAPRIVDSTRHDSLTVVVVLLSVAVIFGSFLYKYIR